MAISGFDAEGSSPMRSALFWPTVDSRKEVRPATRRDLLKKARAMYENDALTGRLVEAMVVKSVGSGLRLQSLTKDRAWNAEREKAWENRSKSETVFDVGRKFNFRGFCRTLLRGEHLDGDAFVLKSTNAEGTAARFLQYEGPRVGNGYSAADADGWRDGVLADRHSAPISYRFLDGDQHQDIGAAMVLPFVDYRRTGWVRGVSRLGRVLNDLQDRSETKAFIKHGIKAANRIGYGTRGLGRPKLPALGGAMPSTTAQMRKEAIELEELFGSGKVQELGPDGSIEVITDGRPHQNYQTWDETLVRGISLGYGLPYEVVWSIAKLGGAAGRYVIADAAEFVAEEQLKLVDRFAGPAYIYDTAMLMAHGGLRYPDDPEWWMHGWLTPPKLTVDIGRDGKLQLDLQKRMLLTMKDFFGQQQKAWEGQVDQWIDERTYVLDKAYEAAAMLSEKHKVTVPVTMILPPEPGAAPVDVAEEEVPEEEVPEDFEGEEEEEEETNT